MVHGPKSDVIENQLKTATVACESCGNPMPANAWSCPTCGDLNADAEAAEFDFLKRELLADNSYFATPMEPGSFITPMQPWTYASLPGAPVVGPGDNLPGSDGASSSTGAVSSTQPAAPQDTQARARAEQAAGAYPADPGLPSIAAPALPLLPQRDTRTGREAPVAREDNPVLKLRPASGQYPQPQSYGYPRPGNPTPTPHGRQTRRAYAQYAPLVELFGYVGLLGVGHIYAGRVQRGIVLFAGWWVWFLIAKSISLLSHGATDLFTLIIGMLVPFLSCLWLYFDMWRRDG